MNVIDRHPGVVGSAALVLPLSPVKLAMDKTVVLPDVTEPLSKYALSVYVELASNVTGC